MAQAIEISYNLAANGGVRSTSHWPNQTCRRRLIMAAEQVSADTAVYQCKSCERAKGANDFYASNLGRCKDCVKQSVRANREAKADYYRAYDRKRYRDSPERKQAARRSAQSAAGLRSKAKSTTRTRKEQPEKYRARNAVSNAIRDGKLERGTECYFCGCNERLQAHHEDYDHPLDVVWLCASCHGKLHSIKGDFRRTSPETRA